jgi:hypothetical protein
MKAMSNYDWSRFTVRIDISATQQSLYEAWSNQEMMELWFLRLCAYSKGDGTHLAGLKALKRAIPINGIGMAGLMKLWSTAKYWKPMVLIC